MKARCKTCGKRAAKHPAGRPMFCSLRCGYNRAVESMMDWRWCELHNEWWHRDDGCPDCIRIEATVNKE